MDGWMEGLEEQLVRHSERTFSPTLPQGALDMCTHMSTNAHTRVNISVHVLAIFDQKKKKENPKKLPHFSDIPLSGLWLSSIAPLAHLTLDIKNVAITFETTQMET